MEDGEEQGWVRKAREKLEAGRMGDGWRRNGHRWFKTKG